MTIEWKRPIGLLAMSLCLACASQSGTTPKTELAPAKEDANTASENTSPQFAKSEKSVARADLKACRYDGLAVTRGSDADIAEFSERLHGTWVRRATFYGVPMETRSFFHFDMKDRTGTGEAMMIDHVNLGPDDKSDMTGIHISQAEPRVEITEDFEEAVEEGKIPGGELFMPEIVAAHWDIKLTPVDGVDRSQGFKGLRIDMAGDYRGTGHEFPPGGFSFDEQATFFREGDYFVILEPWISPSSGYTEDYLWKHVVLTDGEVDENGNVVSGLRRPTITFVNCKEFFVDRYYKISNATPRPGGLTLAEAWQNMLDLEQLEAVPEVRTR
ncbi:MAG: hypothetical protein AAF604_16005 [Acidobacteriota bacterium]